jgi:membrane associated rhomboid family serine protease
MIFYPQARIKIFFIYKIVEFPSILYLSGWFAMQFYGVLLNSISGASNVGWFAHIGGFLFGCGFAFIVKRRELRLENAA